MLDFSNLPLPSQFEEIQYRLEASFLEAVNILPQNHKTHFTDSKFSGYPYLPKSLNYPKNIEGNYMIFLAQINFEQITSLELFPSQGILQFFISPTITNALVHEDIFQQYFKVRYYPKVLPEKELTVDFSFLPENIMENSPIKREMALGFQHTYEPVSATDYRLKKFVSEQELLLHLEDGRTLEEYYFEQFLGAHHKIGGYPYFIHTDTRKSSTFLKRYDTLLLQIISDDEQGIMWGDSGILKFFINSKKLKQRDFSDIYFQVEQY